MIVVLFYIFASANAFTLSMNNVNNQNWDTLRFSIKENARNWFVNRAIQKGIPWNELYQDSVKNHEQIEYFKEKTENRYLEYPTYFLRPFHGYDDGNMNWKAAHEAEAATLSIGAGYWDNIDPYSAQEWLRGNISENIKSYIKEGHVIQPEIILDVGCSIGVSTEYLYNQFENIKGINGIDLSPYFIGVAKYRANKNKLNIDYFHGLAENTPYLENQFNLITCNFLFHELPEKAANEILDELYRILSYDGVLAIIDMDPSHLDKQLKNNPFRKWAFESTEPHIYNYYLRDMKNMMTKHGLKSVEKKRNDPLNSVWLGTKRHDYSPLKLGMGKNMKSAKRKDDDISFNVKKLASI